MVSNTSFMIYPDGLGPVPGLLMLHALPLRNRNRLRCPGRDSDDQTVNLTRRIR